MARAFPLRVEPAASPRLPDDHVRESWSKANDMGEGVKYQPWGDKTPMPTHSLPALEASKCARLQGQEAFDRYDMALFKAFFEQRKDISSREVLVELAGECGLDVARFCRDYDSAIQRMTVLLDYKEGLKRGVQGIPTVFFSDTRGTVRVVGEVPLAQYRRLMQWFGST